MFREDIADTDEGTYGPIGKGFSAKEDPLKRAEKGKNV